MIDGKAFIKSLVAAATAACVIFSNGAFAATAGSNATATVKVAGVFSMTINTPAVDLGTADPGDYVEIPSVPGYANVLDCKSNTGRTWYVMVRANGPLTGPAGSIDLNNLKWMSTYAGSKNAPYSDLTGGLNHAPAAGFVDFTTSNELVYTSGQSAYNDNNSMPDGTEVQFKYALQLPRDPAPAAGTYTATVTYTMTE